MVTTRPRQRASDPSDRHAEAHRHFALERLDFGEFLVIELVLGDEEHVAADAHAGAYARMGLMGRSRLELEGLLAGLLHLEGSLTRRNPAFRPQDVDR